MRILKSSDTGPPLKEVEMMPAPGDSIPDFDPMQLVSEYQSAILKLAKTDDSQQPKQELESTARDLRLAWESLKGQDDIHDLAFGDILG
ncbi:MAG: hypothetical protein U0903_06885 [Planctomycetales bacterium]